MATSVGQEVSRTRNQTDSDARAAARRIPGRPSTWRRYGGLIVGSLSVGIFLSIWQAVTAARLVPELFLPGPTDIFAELGVLIREGKLWNDLLVSGHELVLGYGLAILVAIPVGILMGWYRGLSWALDPFVSFFYSTPRIALLPLFIIWFGIGINSKVAIIFLGAFFPILINTVAGMHNIEPGLIKVARSYGASDLQIFRTVALPGSVPFTLTGLRLGIGHALIGVVVGELIAAQAGIGLMMANAGATYQTSRVFVGLFILAFAGLALTYILQLLERRFQSWKPSH
ncbi:MAG TPA: ABC transporter permease [Chloroflexota bacterium]|jgi:NitT/TauT family transport system permease protein